MLRRTLLLTTALLLSFGATACGDDDSTADSGTEANTSNESSDGGAGDASETPGSDLSEALDDLDSLEGVTGMENLDECIAVGTTYAGLALSALGGEDAAADAQEAIEKLKDDLPDELDDALDTVATAYGEVAEKGLIDGAEALDSEAYQQADAEIQAYLEETCGSAGGG